MNECNILIGKNNENNAIDINIGKENLAIFGSAGMSKRQSLLYNFAKQSASSDKVFGSTYIINDIDDAYFVYAIAQRLKKKNKIVFIKPSNNVKIYNAIINDEAYDFDNMNELFDYSNYIRRRNIVIIDPEEYKYGKLSKKFLQKILLHMWICLQRQDITLRRQHYLFINDADEIFEDLRNIIKFGQSFNFNTIAFFKSIDLLNKEQKIFIEYFVKNKMILASDRRYYHHEDVEVAPKEVLFILLNPLGESKSLTGTFIACEDNELNSLLESSKKIKKEDTVPDNGYPMMMLIKNFNKLPEAKPVKKVEAPTTSVPIKAEFEKVVVDAVLKAKEPYNGDVFSLKLTPAQEKHIKNVVEQKNTEKKTAEVKALATPVVPVEVAPVDTKIKSEEKPKKAPAEGNKGKKNKKIEVNDEDIIVKITPKEEIKPVTLESELEDTIERMAERELSVPITMPAEESFTEEVLDADEDTNSVPDEVSENIENEKKEMRAMDNNGPKKVVEKATPGTEFLDIELLLSDE